MTADQNRKDCQAIYFDGILIPFRLTKYYLKLEFYWRKFEIFCTGFFFLNSCLSRRTHLSFPLSNSLILAVFDTTLTNNLSGVLYWVYTVLLSSRIASVEDTIYNGGIRNYLQVILWKILMI